MTARDGIDRRSRTRVGAPTLEPAPTEGDREPFLRAYRVGGAPVRLVPAPRERAWIEATRQRFANRCLPLLVANQAGWFLLNSHDLTVTWDGGVEKEALHLEYRGGAPPYPAVSHFGHGILTWHVPYLFRTPPGWNLLARGPANLPKPGIAPLEGLVEADWAVATFTMNWQLTAVNTPVTFGVDEPVCQLVPQRRGELETFRPEVRELAADPEVEAAYRAWTASRGRFLAELREPGSEAVQRGWQKDYFRGRAPDGTEAPAHQTKLRLREFADPDGICPPPRPGPPMDIPPSIPRMGERPNSASAQSALRSLRRRSPMEQGSQRPSLALRRLVNGYQVTQAIHVAATLGIADLLAGGPRTSDDLGAATGSHAGALYRLLRALASVGVFREEEGRRFALTELGACLRSDAAEPVGAWAAFVGEPYHWQVWGDLLHSVRTGENAFRHVHGTDPWTFRARHPELSAGFDRAMMSLARQVSAAVLAAYDFGRFGTVVDVGGGNGTFLAAILAAHPATRGVLFDQPHVVAGAGPILATAGVADRCEVVAGSFFEAVPPGGDAYVLKAILHDWEDEQCVEILRTCRRATRDGAALLVVEQELGLPNQDPAAKFSDLNMLVGPGGQERTPADYAALFEAAGFRFVGFTPSAVGTGVFEGIAA